MVTSVVERTLSSAVLWGQQSQMLIERLDPVVRVKVLAALAGLVILGFALVFLTWMAGRATRRYMNSGRAPRTNTRISEHDWARPRLTTKRNTP